MVLTYDRTMHVHQFVKVSVSPTKTEIGVIVAIRGDEADVSTRHGFDVTAKLSQLQRVFLLVLDLNGVLVARMAKKFVKRPVIDEFVKFALANFVVGVWSSCEERNGKHIVDEVFGGLQDRLLFQMYRPDCRPFPTADRPYGTIKDLQKIFDRHPESFNALTTIIVDDSPDKCSHPDNALCPPPFAVTDLGEVMTEADEAGAPGFVQTMEVLRDVLRQDGLTPLIGAAARRTEAMEKRSAAAAAAAAAAASASPAAAGGNPSPTGPSDIMNMFRQKFTEAALREAQQEGERSAEAAACEQTAGMRQQQQAFGGQQGNLTSFQRREQEKGLGRDGRAKADRRPQQQQQMQLENCRPSSSKGSNGNSNQQHQHHSQNTLQQQQQEQSQRQQSGGGGGGSRRRGGGGQQQQQQQQQFQQHGSGGERLSAATSGGGGGLNVMTILRNAQRVPQQH
jgi:hypothetical protein